MHSFSILTIFHNLTGHSINTDLLKSFVNLNYPKNKIEFIFLNNNSRNNTLTILNEFKKKSKLNIKIINSKKSLSIGKARNTLMANGRNDIILFTDDDVEVPPDWIKNVDMRFRTSNIDILGGVMRSKQNGIIATFEEIRKFVKYNSIKKTNSKHFETVNLSFKKKLTKKLRFNEKIKVAEDYEFCKKAERLGLKMFFDINNFVYHKFDTEIWSYLRRHFWYGYGLFYVDKKYKIYTKIMKITILYHILLPIIFLLSFSNFIFVFLFIPLLLEKYVFHSIKRAFLSKVWHMIPLIILLEFMRFYSWCIGYIYGGIRNEKI